jgi:hypothetical protein
LCRANQDWQILRTKGFGKPLLVYVRVAATMRDKVVQDYFLDGEEKMKLASDKNQTLFHEVVPNQDWQILRQGLWQLGASRLPGNYTSAF